MPSLEAVEAFLVMNESELLQDFLVGLIAAPQLAVFFENIPACARSSIASGPAGSAVYVNGSTIPTYPMIWLKNLRCISISSYWAAVNSSAAYPQPLPRWIAKALRLVIKHTSSVPMGRSPTATVFTHCFTAMAPEPGRLWLRRSTTV